MKKNNKNRKNFKQQSKNNFKQKKRGEHRENLQKIGHFHATFGNQLILKIEGELLPLPNQNIFCAGNVVGKSDEIFGTETCTFLSVKLTGRLMKKDGDFLCAKNIRREFIK